MGFFLIPSSGSALFYLIPLSCRNIWQWGKTDWHCKWGKTWTIHKSLWEFFLFHQHWQLLSLSSSSSCVFAPSLLLLAIAACHMLRVEGLSWRSLWTANFVHFLSRARLGFYVLFSVVIIRITQEQLSVGFILLSPNWYLTSSSPLCLHHYHCVGSSFLSKVVPAFSSRYSCTITVWVHECQTFCMFFKPSKLKQSLRICYGCCGGGGCMWYKQTTAHCLELDFRSIQRTRQLHTRILQSKNNGYSTGQVLLVASLCSHPVCPAVLYIVKLLWQKT